MWSIYVGEEMITRKKFDFIKENYSQYASWAVWAEQEEKPKSKIGDLTILDPDINENLLSELNPEVVLVALNFSLDVKHQPWGNFHSNRPHATDYKTRFALKDSALWGGYMTDIIKNYPEKESGNVSIYLKLHREFEQNNIKFFRKELKVIGANNPLLVAFGNEVNDVLNRNITDLEILKIPHYASHQGAAPYREEVLKLIKNRAIGN